ncbi:MAG: hypothetical protein E7Z87_04825 [Cyanobacteria bacterium SIG26]|nr:hypothetical protein [Cyanobacteria bacterium SIG26]
MRINFTPIQFNRPNYTQQYQAVRFHPQLNADIVCFTGKEEQDLLLQDDKTILRRIKKAIKKENSLGRGGEAEVYKIPNTKYCVRVPHDAFDIVGNFVDKEITPKDTINHTVAKLDNNITIMPYIEGYTFCSSNIKNEQVAKMIEEMPQAAVNNLFRQVCEAHNNKLAFDTGWKNIIVDPINKKLTAIDFVSTDVAFSNDKILNKVYLSLTNNPDTTKQQRKTFAGKWLTAIAENLEFHKNPIDDIEALGLKDFHKILKSHKLLDKTEYYTTLKNILTYIESSKLKESYGLDIEPYLNGQIKVLKSLIAQLF